jgi:hypothetical protein
VVMADGFMMTAEMGMHSSTEDPKAVKYEIY